MESNLGDVRLTPDEVAGTTGVSSKGGVTAAVIRFEAEAVPSFVVHGSKRFGVLIGSTDDVARRAATAGVGSSFRHIASRRGLEILIEDGAKARCAPAVVRSATLAAEAVGQHVMVNTTRSWRPRAVTPPTWPVSGPLAFC